MHPATLPEEKRGVNRFLRSAARGENRVGSDWGKISPEEWVARHIHEIPLWGWADFRFPTPEFDRWLREAEVHAHDFKGRDALRRRFLSEEEIAEAIARERDPF